MGSSGIRDPARSVSIGGLAGIGHLRFINRSPDKSGDDAPSGLTRGFYRVKN
jgi:hypothetical protein